MMDSFKRGYLGNRLREQYNGVASSTRLGINNRSLTGSITSNRPNAQQVVDVINHIEALKEEMIADFVPRSVRTRFLMA